MSARWSPLLTDQLEFYWKVHLWPRLEGLTDEEYLWEPVPGCLSVRPAAGGGFAIDEAPDDKPRFTTIAWRMMHVAIGCLGNRGNAFFGDQSSVPDDAIMLDDIFAPAAVGAAAEALALLDESYRRWFDGICAMDDDNMMSPLGPRGGRYAADPMAALVLHISRETMHHGAEICLLRDLYRDSRPSNRVV